ncbi:MAG: hypothetical protein AAFY16_02245 [Cyanobacteria bacterium J06642_3]
MINDSSKQKISPEFAARLNSYPPTAKVRVIVLLESINPQLTNNSHRQNRSERKAAIKVMQDSVEQSWQIVDRLIKDFDGKKLAPKPDAFSAIPLEITIPGILALAQSDAVKAVIENQKIYSIE